MNEVRVCGMIGNVRDDALWLDGDGWEVEVGGELDRGMCVCGYWKYLAGEI
jgi:hypothetical protein